MSDAEFLALARRIHGLTGIDLPPQKRPLAVSRLSKRVRALGLPGFGAYLAHLDTEEGADEIALMINVITTNLTAFFRENHHFDDLVDTLAAARPSLDGNPRLRIWSAACSTGEEPYSIAMAVQRSGIVTPGTDFRILATDIDTEVLDAARRGVYPGDRLDGCPPDYRRDFFQRLPGDRVQVKKKTRNLISFNQLNIHHVWPMKGPFDAIFCRNVLIYFDKKAKRDIIERMVAMLRAGAPLYLGHSESLLGNHPELVRQGRTAFRKRQ